MRDLKHAIISHCGQDEEALRHLRLLHKQSTSLFLPYRDAEPIGSTRKIQVVGVDLAEVRNRPEREEPTGNHKEILRRKAEEERQAVCKRKEDDKAAFKHTREVEDERKKAEEEEARRKRLAEESVERKKTVRKIEMWD
eukprot:gnl/TRDRNA2_/TRDRNA2_164573_c1_seq4.p2 gnl/TRDRNA2_/TRDRNA2_164573_c1~~gnl/TRDRNA2_/TRDRNA2_164573_c1_seq4.p2  ORF type:complete len:139 (-),score=28.85 gnl/TRDRNA2_/TRDRNA2_164573_c1_seq4:340-756(-)